MLANGRVFGALVAVFAVAACSTAGKSDTTATMACARDNTPAALLCAKRQFEQVVRNDPKQKYAWYDLAVIAQGAKDSTTAVRDYEQAISIDPRFEAPLYNLGVIRLQAGDYAAAVALLNRAVASNPDDANAFEKLALALVHIRSAAANEQANVALNKARKLDPRGFLRVPSS